MMEPFSNKPLKEKELFSDTRSLTSVCYSLRNHQKYDFHQQGIPRPENTIRSFISCLSGNIDVLHPASPQPSESVASESSESTASGAD